MRDRIKKALKNQDGSAILFAIAIMVVLVVFALALLLVSYSLFSTASREQTSLQSREMAQTLSTCLQYELEAETTANIMGTSDFYEEYPLWNEVYDGISGNKWLDYDPSVYGHSKERTVRYYTLSVDRVQNGLTEDYAREMNKYTEISLYWKKPLEVEEDNNSKDGATLVVTVSCGLGDKKTTVTTYYELKTRIGTKTDGTEVELWKWELTKRE